MLAPPTVAAALGPGFGCARPRRGGRPGHLLSDLALPLTISWRFSSPWFRYGR